VILVTVIAFALLASKTEPYGLAPKKKMDKKKKTKKKNTPAPGYGLGSTMKSFATKFHSYLKTYYAADARVAPLLALWSGDFKTDRYLPTEFSMQNGVLVMGIPQQWNSGEFPHMRTKLLRFLAGKVSRPKDATYMARFLDTWGFYLRVATEKLGSRMRSPPCIAQGRCDPSMCPKCEM
jgi:hypothetical protein